MKKMMIATLAAASVLLAVANQAHAGATLDAVPGWEWHLLASLITTALAS